MCHLRGTLRGPSMTLRPSCERSLMLIVADTSPERSVTTRVLQKRRPQTRRVYACRPAHLGPDRSARNPTDETPDVLA